MLRAIVSSCGSPPDRVFTQAVTCRWPPVLATSWAMLRRTMLVGGPQGTVRAVCELRVNTAARG